MWGYLYDFFQKSHAILGFFLALIAIANATIAHAPGIRNYAIMGGVTSIVRTFPVSASVLSGLLDKPSNKGKFCLDFIDLGENYLLQAELPGSKKEDIDVDIDEYNRSLTISSEARDLCTNKGTSSEQIFCIRERHIGRLSRSLHLPKDVNLNNITAKYEDGILQLQMPKQVLEKKNRKIKLL